MISIYTYKIRTFIISLLHQSFLVLAVVGVRVHKTIHSSIVGTVSSSSEVVITSLVENENSGGLSKELSDRLVSKSGDILFQIVEVVVTAVKSEGTSEKTY